MCPSKGAYVEPTSGRVEAPGIRPFTVFAPTGKALHVKQVKPMLKAPGTKRLVLIHDKVLSSLLSISTCAATHRRRVRRLPGGGGPDRGGHAGVR